MISLQDTHLSRCKESVSCPFKEQLCNTYFPSRLWHVMLLLCTVQTLLWRKNGSFPPQAHRCRNWALRSIIFAEICVCASEWWDPAGPPLLHGRGGAEGLMLTLRGFRCIPATYFDQPVSSWSALGGVARRTTSSLISPKDLQPACPRRAQECKLKHSEWGWLGDSLQKHTADQT